VSAKALEAYVTLIIFTGSQVLPDYMNQWGLGEAGFKYNVVAVFGSQSTGKSKLTKWRMKRIGGLTFFYGRYSSEWTVWDFI
jgi:hypothetical protein